MSESHEAQLFVLTDAERAAIEQPGLKQRAKTILVVAELATALGVSDDIREALLERVRSMDGQEAKALRKGATHLNEVVRGLEFGAQTTHEAVAELPPEQEVAGTSEIEVALDPNPEEVLLQGEKYTFDFDAVQSFYKVINKKTSSEWLAIPDSPSDVDPDEILALIELDARNNPKPSHAKRIADKLIAHLQPDAPNDQSAHSFKFSTTNRIAKYLDNLEAEKPVASPVVVEQLAPVKAPEMEKLDDEPVYVQIAERYETLLGLDRTEVTAFRCLINPDNRGEMTDNKLRVITKLRGRITEELGSLHGVRGKLAPAEAVRVATLLGFYMREKNTDEQPPLELSHQLRRATNSAERHALTANLHKGLEKLADLLDSEELAAASGDVVPMPSPRPLQVQISNGKPVLA